MEKFIEINAIAAPLLEINIDTDVIIPSREMKRVSKEGLGEGLFAGRRYTQPGGREENPEFILNQPPYRDALPHAWTGGADADALVEDPVEAARAFFDAR